jgi:16S rRNA U516 pseudouridylate synthase RsuA-like enzyme
VLADAGVASRRACEALIEAGRVEVNGRTVRGLPAFVDPASDRICVDGRPIRTGGRPRPAAATEPSGGRGEGRRLYIMLNKPAKVVTSTRDEYGRRTVLDLVDHPARRAGAARLFPVGRLEYDTTGLVLLTNDGELAHRLTHARFGVTRTYRVEVKARSGPDTPAPAAGAAEIPADHANGSGALRAPHAGSADTARLERQAIKASRAARRAAGRPARGAAVQIRELPGRPGARHGRRTLEVTLAEGRNRQVALVLRRAGYAIRSVECVGLGPIRLRGLAVGDWRELDRAEVRALRQAAGLVRSSQGGDVGGARVSPVNAHSAEGGA